MEKWQKVKLWLAVIIWAGVIFWFSSREINNPNIEFSWLDFVIKKTAHVIEYAIFYWLIFRAMSENGLKSSRKVLILSFLLAWLYSMSDEWHQTFVPGREGTLRDVGFDTIGMLLSLNQIKKNL